MAQNIAMKGFENTLEAQVPALVARLTAMKMRMVADIARAFGLPEPFASDEDRVARLKASAMPPERCGPDMIAAPARGPMIAFAPQAIMPKGESDYDAQHVGYRGRDAARAADAFDVMEAQARRKMGKAYAPLFSKGQVNVGRRYAELVERHDAGGVKLSSLEGRTGGSGRGADVMDIRLAERRDIDAFHAAIGSVIVFKEKVDRDGNLVKPGLDARRLVHLVCCNGLTVTQVIKRCGRASDGERRALVRGALVSALDRMAH